MAKMSMLRDAQSRIGTQDSNGVSLTVKDIPVGDITVKENVRKTYTGIDELAASIKLHGLLQPITVYPAGDEYIVKTGHRRFMAVQLLYAEEPERFNRIRCIVSDNNNLAIVQLVENIQREDLSQIDRYHALCALREQGLTLKQIANAMGKTESYIKKCFVGINEIQNDGDLENAIGFAGVTIDDVIDTKGIADKSERFALLTRRGNGEITRAEMRGKAKELKDNQCLQNGTSTSPAAIEQPLPEVRLSISANSITVTFPENCGQLLQNVEKDIRQVLFKRKIKIVEFSI